MKTLDLRNLTSPIKTLLVTESMSARRFENYIFRSNLTFHFENYIYHRSLTFPFEKNLTMPELQEVLFESAIGDMNGHRETNVLMTVIQHF